MPNQCILFCSKWIHFPGFHNVGCPFRESYGYSLGVFPNSFGVNFTLKIVLGIIVIFSSHWIWGAMPLTHMIFFNFLFQSCKFSLVSIYPFLWYLIFSFSKITVLKPQRIVFLESFFKFVISPLTWKWILITFFFSF